MGLTTHLSGKTVLPCCFYNAATRPMRNYASNRTFVSPLSTPLPAPPANNVFRGSKPEQSEQKEEGEQIPVMFLAGCVWVIKRRRLDHSEVPREGERESCSRSQGHIHTFTITMRGADGCPLRIRTAQQRGHTHTHTHTQQAHTHTYTVCSLLCTHKGRLRVKITHRNSVRSQYCRWSGKWN